MLEHIGSWLGTWLLWASGVWGLCVLGDVTMRQEHKKRLSDWLTGQDRLQSLAQWGTLFLHLFDGIFGKRRCSIRFLLVSFASSVFFATTLLFLWASLYREQYCYYFEFFGFGTGVAILCLFLLVNLIPDYLSNCQSRYIVGQLNQSDRRISSFTGWLMLDLVLTFLITAAIFIPLSLEMNHMVIFVSTGIFGWSWTLSDWKLIDFFEYFSLSSTIFYSRHDDMTGGHIKNISPPYGVFLYTTFLTSVWLWFYTISGLFVIAIRGVLGQNSIIFKAWCSLCDFKKYPFGSVGFFCAVFVTMIYVGFTALDLLVLENSNSSSSEKILECGLFDVLEYSRSAGE